MGLSVKINNKGQYKLISSFDDKAIHKKSWISEKEAKKILIDRAFWRFFKEVLDIDTNFPAGYFNDMKMYTHKDGKESGAEKYLKLLKAKSNEPAEKEWERLKKEYELDF